MTRTSFRTAALVSASALALALSACKIDNRPLLARGEPPAYGPAAPAPGPLDPGYAQVSYLPPEEAYAYPERAYEMSRVFYERPPSYAFPYEDEQPWAWEAADRGRMFAEPLDDGWRYYYYEAGEDHPYFIQDPDYAYGFGDGGVLVALFSAAGALLSADAYDDHYPRARDYWRRGYDLHQTYDRAPRRAVEQTVWLEQAPLVVGAHERWFRAASAQPAWREAAPRGDNGRRLGWYKDRGERQVADLREAAPAPRFEREAGPPGHARKEARKEERRAENRDRGRESREAVRQARSAEAHAKHAAWDGGGKDKPGREAHRGGSGGGRHEGGDRGKGPDHGGKGHGGGKGGGKDGGDGGHGNGGGKGGK